MSRLIPTEHEDQKAVVDWARLNERRWPQFRLLFAIPNGGKRNIVVARKLRAEGVKPGVPDLFLPVSMWIDDKVWSTFSRGLFIEMKRKGGRPTPEQLRWHADLREQGYLVEVCEGFAAAIAMLKTYLGA